MVCVLGAWKQRLQDEDNNLFIVSLTLWVKPEPFSWQGPLLGYCNHFKEKIAISLDLPRVFFFLKR